MILVVGGVKSGKSMLATLDPCDEEDRRRIALHRRDREGWGFRTLEEPYDPAAAGEKLEGDEVVLADSLTALLGNRMFGPHPQEDPVEALAAGLEALDRRAREVVAVTDDLFSDAALYEGITLRYRQLLGRLNIRAARQSRVVLECTHSLVAVRKGELPCLGRALALFAEQTGYLKGSVL